MLLSRIKRGDAKGRSFGTPRNPRSPTLDEFNPRIHEVRAGDLDSAIVGRKHGLFPEQQQAIARMSNEELLSFRYNDPMSVIGVEGGLSITGGHHRLAEIARRVAAGDLPSDTIIRILLHD